MGGLDPGVALGSTRVYRSLSRDPRNSCFTSPPAFGCTGSAIPGGARGSPTHVGLTPSYTVYSLSFIFGFLKTKYSIIFLLISTVQMSGGVPVMYGKMETSKKRERKYFQTDE